MRPCRAASDVGPIVGAAESQTGESQHARNPRQQRVDDLACERMLCRPAVLRFRLVRGGCLLATSLRTALRLTEVGHRTGTGLAKTQVRTRKSQQQTGQRRQYCLYIHVLNPFARLFLSCYSGREPGSRFASRPKCVQLRVRSARGRIVIQVGRACRLVGFVFAVDSQ